MHIRNGAQLLNITLLPLSFACLAAAAAVAPAPVILTVPLTSRYATAKPHNLELRIVAWDLILLLALYDSFYSSFIVTQWMIDLINYCPASFQYFDIPFLYYYVIILALIHQ